MSTALALFTVTLYRASGRQADAGVLFRANVRLPALDLSIRDFTVWEGRDERGPYVMVPARRYETASGETRSSRYLDGDGVQALKAAILRAARAEAPEAFEGIATPSTREAASAADPANDDIPF